MTKFGCGSTSRLLSYDKSQLSLADETPGEGIYDN